MDASAARSKSPPGNEARRSRQKLVALHHQVYLTLRNELIRGHYGGADGRTAVALPAENELAAQFEVSRVTIRRALAALEGEGLVVRRHGSGTFAVPMPSHLRRARDVASLYDELTDLVQGYQQDVVELRCMSTPAFVLRRAADFGPDCVHLSVVSWRDGAPAHLNLQYVPARLAGPLAMRPKQVVSLLLALRERGVHADTFDLNISATAADLATSTRLDVPVGIPLIATRRISRDAGGATIEYFEALTRPDLYSYTFRFDATRR